MKRILTTLAFFGLSATMAHAETLGTITANWEGEARTWFITSMDGESQSAHTNTAQIIDGFVLWGNPDADKLASTSDVVSLEFTLMAGHQDSEVIDPALHYLVAGFADQWDASGEGQTEVTIDMFEKSDAAVRVTGAFHATATRAAETREIDGVFDVTFPID